MSLFAKQKALVPTLGPAQYPAQGSEPILYQLYFGTLLQLISRNSVSASSCRPTLKRAYAFPNMRKSSADSLSKFRRLRLANLDFCSEKNAPVMAGSK